MTLKTRLSCSMKWACRKGDCWNEKDCGVPARHSGAAGTSVTRTLPAPVISIITTFVCPVNNLFFFTTNFDCAVQLSLFHIHLENWKYVYFVSNLLKA